MTEPAKDRYEKMQYRRAGRSGLKLPAISLGAWETFGGYRNADVARACVTRAFDLGITHFDFANNYGHPPGNAEIVCGRVLKELPRDDHRQQGRFSDVERAIRRRRITEISRRQLRPNTEAARR